MYVSFSRYSGPYELDNRLPTKASTVLEVGDVLKDDTGLAPATSDSELLGLCLQARASVANQDSIMIMLILDRAKFYGAAESGTFDREDDGGLGRDLASADGIAADVNTNKDFLVSFVLSTTQAVGKFTHLATTFR